MPRHFDRTNVGAVKLSLTLSADSAEEIRLLADKAGITLAQLVRQSVGLYRFVKSLSESEELWIRNTATGDLTRVALVLT